MSWTETHRRWAALREIAETAGRRADGELPWTKEYAEIFGDREQLLAMLRYRWEMTAQAQLDSHLAEEQLDERRQDLVERNAGVLRLLREYDREQAIDLVEVKASA